MIKFFFKICLSIWYSTFISISAFSAEHETKVEKQTPVKSAVAANSEDPKESTNSSGLDNLINSEMEKATAMYTVVLSDGNGPRDKDILITRRNGKIYSFKYCKAENADGSPSVIAKVRQLRFTQPTYFKNPNSIKTLNQFFNSSSCHFFDGSNYDIPITKGKLYGEVNHYEVNQVSRGDKVPYENSSDITENSGWLGAGSVLFAIAGFGSGIVTGTSYSKSRSQNQTLSASKFIFSKNFPWSKTFFTTSLLAAAGGLIHYTTQSMEKNASIDAIAYASYVNAYYDEKPDETAHEFVTPSMEEFLKHFSAGLNLLTKKNYFTEL